MRARRERRWDCFARRRNQEQPIGFLTPELRAIRAPLSPPYFQLGCGRKTALWRRTTQLLLRARKCGGSGQRVHTKSQSERAESPHRQPLVDAECRAIPDCRLWPDSGTSEPINNFRLLGYGCRNLLASRISQGGLNSANCVSEVLGIR
jgi:hypothetical protein